MSIDEAIDYVEDINTTVGWNKDQVQDADFFLNVAEWLEGYKKFLEFQKNCTFDNKVYCYGFDEGYEQGRADGAREFAKWLSNTEYVANHDSFILPLRGYFTIDDVVKEWAKEQKQ